MHFLSSIVDSIFPPRPNERLVRTMNPSAFSSLLTPRILPSALYTTALLPYQNELVKAAIVEAKFYRNARATKILGDILSDYLLEWTSDRLSGERIVLIPIPLSRHRTHDRGYNQVDAVIRKALRSSGATYELRLLTRVRNTTPQTKLSGKARRENMLGAFTCAKRLHPDVFYVVVDDVTTTGATLHAAADALTKAGAQRITLLALAH